MRSIFVQSWEVAGDVTRSRQKLYSGETSRRTRIFNAPHLKCNWRTNLQAKICWLWFVRIHYRLVFPITTILDCCFTHLIMIPGARGCLWSWRVRGGPVDPRGGWPPRGGPPTPRRGAVDRRVLRAEGQTGEPPSYSPHISIIMSNFMSWLRWLNIYFMFILISFWKTYSITNCYRLVTNWTKSTQRLKLCFLQTGVYQNWLNVTNKCKQRSPKHPQEIEFLVVEAKKSNLEPKPTALIFLEA